MTTTIVNALDASAAHPLPVNIGGTGIATATTYAVLCGGTAATGPFQSIASVGAAGQLLTSNGAGALPTFQTYEIGTIVNQTTNTATLAAGSKYICNNGVTLITFTLPVTAAIGDTYRIIGGSSGGWTVAQNANQQINSNSSHTTTGVGGSITSVGGTGNQYNWIEITCVGTNNTFSAMVNGAPTFT